MEGQIMFHKELFSNDSEYLRYEGEIVARFKYSGPFTKAKFKKFLIKSGLTPQSYREMRQAGIAPLDVWEQIDPASYNAILDAARAKACG